jgi:hypothetical protein
LPRARAGFKPAPTARWVADGQAGGRCPLWVAGSGLRLGRLVVVHRGAAVLAERRGARRARRFDKLY